MCSALYIFWRISGILVIPILVITVVFLVFSCDIPAVVVYLLCDLYFDNVLLIGAWCPGRGDSKLYWLVFTVDT
jgi:hypothetical protein